jgi:cathepsin B
MMLQLVALVITVVVSTTFSFPTWEDLPVVDAELIAKVNRLGKWRADFSKQFYNMTIREARRLTGTFVDLPDDALPRKSFDARVDLPDVFDARKQWPNAIHPIRNQLQCGSCWAFAATEVLSDRFAIQNSDIDVILSPQQLVSCDNKDGNMGCQGGYPIRAWKYMKQTG